MSFTEEVYIFVNLYIRLTTSIPTHLQLIILFPSAPIFSFSLPHNPTFWDPFLSIISHWQPHISLPLPLSLWLSSPFLSLISTLLISLHDTMPNTLSQWLLSNRAHHQICIIPMLLTFHYHTSFSPWLHLHHSLPQPAILTTASASVQPHHQVCTMPCTIVTQPTLPIALPCTTIGCHPHQPRDTARITHHCHFIATLPCFQISFKDMGKPFH